ncbi:MAG: HD-GYP domain-containing protein [Treponema sp.]|jgi:putative two-component system response regulator|nr:HD-GYP domain-containing protein [Treponema sp.]
MLDDELATLEELETLEPVEELVEEAGEDYSSHIGLLGKAIGLGRAEDSLTEFSIPAALNPFMTSMFPILFVDRQLKIIATNQACDNLFIGFPRMQQNYFFDIFGKFFQVEDIRKIRETIVGGKNGYSWKGETKIKSHDMATVQTRVYLFAAEIVKNPGQFVIMFDDVTEENKQLLRAVFLSLLEASKLKDNDTGKHITRVNYYSKRLAEELFYSLGPQYPNIDADFIDNIGFLASMHDVGKIGTPDDILNKEGPLSDWEWTVMREHTKNGAFILSTYPNPMAKEIALSHHERWDGGGYPFQLEGEMIPLAARIVSIADVYDALRMQRSYKPALSHEVSVSKMMAERGTHFDPFLIEVFRIIADEFDKIFEINRDND